MNDKYLYEIWLASCRGVSCRGRLLLMELFGGAEGVYNASSAELQQVADAYGDLISQGKGRPVFAHDLEYARGAIKRADACGAGILSINDAEYPEHLAGIPDPPTILYYKGDLSIVKEPGVAIVGTRRCSPYGRWVAGEIAKRIASCGVNVISGMAEGIDSAGHKGCMAAGGKTAAVFGTGIDVCFPNSNAGLYAELQKNHLTISELAPGERGAAWNFPQRNRIISGLSKDVIVVEGAVKSGSMITAGLAAEQGRGVFAVPGNINQPCSIGVNKLIMDGATPIIDLDEVPETLGIQERGKRKRAAALSPEEAKLLKIIKENSGMQAELVVDKAGISAPDCLALISSLELKGLVNSEGRRLFAL